MYAEKDKNEFSDEALAFPVNSGDKEPDLPINNKNSNKIPMIYKLYKERTKSMADESGSNNLSDEFKKIYDKNGVKVIGLWINADDPHEQFFMTGYKNEAHYQEFVEKVKDDPIYRDMTDKINKDRESIEVITLIPALD